MLKRLTGSRPVQVIQAYGKSQGSNYATGLAFIGFLSMFPLILGMLSIVGLVVHDPSVQAKLYAQVVSIFPKEARGSVSGALDSVRRHAGILGIVSIVGLLWSGTSLFAAMEFALTRIFGTEQRDMLRQRLMGLGMVMVFILAVLLSVGANTVAAAVPGLGVLGALLGALVLVGLMTAIYRFVPNRTFTMREIWPGAVLAGVLVELFSLLFQIYAKVSGGFGTYGQSFGLFFLLATWLGFMSQFILIGAVYNKLRLGTPQNEGMVSASGDDSREHTDPAQAIDEQARRGGRDAAGRSAPGRSAAGSPTAVPTEDRAAIHVGIAAAAVSAVAERLRRR